MLLICSQFQQSCREIIVKELCTRSELDLRAMRCGMTAVIWQEQEHCRIAVQFIYSICLILTCRSFLAAVSRKKRKVNVRIV